VRAQTRRFVEDEVVPQADAWERSGFVPRDVLQKMGSIGFFGLRVEEEYGGVGMGPLASCVFAEELGRSTFGGFTATVIVHTDLAMPYLRIFGTDAQKRRWLPGLVSGEAIAAIAVTEPDAGSDVAAIRTTARPDGDGFVINGSKLYITNGVHGGLVFVAARTDPDVKSSRGMSIFAVPSDTDGLTVSRSLEKLGWRSSDTAELSFQDCWIPADHLIGERNRGFYHVMHNFQNERLVLGAAAIGESAKAIELTLAHVRERSAFGGPLWSKQAVRQRLAMRRAEVDAGRQLLYHAAWLVEQGEDAVQEVSEVKAYVGELVNRVLYDCVQFHGGMGYMAESPIERMFRDARIHSIGGGATEVMLEEIAKRM
jgi:acyl-CoA dehydrogenase